jgi:GNAT superfamily N-acetyltransferase
MPPHDTTWVDQLPDELTGQRTLLRGLLSFCGADESIRWLVLGCSVARGAGDHLSDLDLAMGVRDDDFAAALPKIRLALDGLGELVDRYQHQLPSVTGAHLRIFAQYADRCQVDLVVFPASASAEPFAGVVALYDPDGVIVTRAHREPPTPAQVREWAFHGWCALADVGKYLRRQSAWEALIQLNNARDQLWRLLAVARGVPDPQFGVISILDFAPETITPDMAATVADLDLARLVSAARQLANLLDQIGQQLPVQYRAAWPEAMARYVTSDLRQLPAARETAAGNTALACCQAVPVAISVRPARPEDVPVLIQLRLANAERHAGLDPAGHRLPEPGAVRRYFSELLSGSAAPDVTVLVAELSGSVAGMTEIVLAPASPDHQILIPRRTAQVHTVVLKRYRGQGIGTALVTAAEQHAAQHGVTCLVAPILESNAEAVTFYTQAGYDRHGIILRKELVS